MLSQRTGKRYFKTLGTRAIKSPLSYPSLVPNNNYITVILAVKIARSYNKLFKSVARKTQFFKQLITAKAWPKRKQEIHINSVASLYKTRSFKTTQLTFL